MKIHFLIASAVLSALLAGCGKEPETEVQNDPDPSPGKASAPQAPDASAPRAQPLTMQTLPMPEGARFVTSVRDTRTIMLRGENDLAKVRRHFDTSLADAGWVADTANSEIVDGVGFLEYNKGALHITITLNPDRDGQTMTYILQGSGIDAPEEDSDES